MNYIICKICRSEIVACYGDRTNIRMLTKQFCFHCNFWDELVELANTPNSIRVKGKHYMLGPTAGEKVTACFNGHAFRIKFDDGRFIATENLWYQGLIPERWLDLLPDNAQFIN